ncbi:B12-binding domain-containing radical SAM protein [Parasulfuritortus cantonensis]|nr:B12-binding domain-containing radical SAM protein [Parasulfuritortus cantonensis]
MRRRLVIIALPWMRKHDDLAPLGHASLVAALRLCTNVDVRQVINPVNHDGFSLDGLVAGVLAELEGIPQEHVDIGIGAYVWNDEYVKYLLRSLRSHGFQGRIIMGGPQVSYAGAGIDHIYPEADVFVRGHAELALCALVQARGRPRIKGIHYSGEDDLCEQAETDMVRLPSPWLNGTIQLGKQSSVHWETQRGCNFHCSFCQHRQPNAHTIVSRMSNSRVEDEIDLFCDVGVKRISVLDPIFNSDPVRAPHILQQFAQRGFQGELSLQCRLEMVDDRFLEAAKTLNVSLEFGLQSIHKREYLAVGRPNNMRKVEQTLQKVRRANIRHEVSLIYGLPEQTLESFESSVDWCLRQRIPVIKAFPLLLLRGTELEAKRDDWSFMTMEGRVPIVVSARSFSRMEWQEMERIASALAQTEGNHPDCLRALMSLSGRADYPSNVSQLRALGKA